MGFSRQEHWSELACPPLGESSCHCKRPGFDAWFGKIPWRREWLMTLVFLPGESHGQRSLASYSSQSHRVGHDWSNLAHMYERHWVNILCNTIYKNSILILLFLADIFLSPSLTFYLSFTISTNAFRIHASPRINFLSLKTYSQNFLKTYIMIWKAHKICFLDLINWYQEYCNEKYKRGILF